MDRPTTPREPQHLPANGGRAQGFPAIPGYRIVRELGFGGMAVVYEADQIGLKRRVALKMGLDGPSHDAELLARFQTEAEAAASLHHPNIVEIYEIGESAGRPYFSMPLIEGGTLAGELALRPASTRRAAQITEVLARAIHYAHERGIVHRDLKPANVLLEMNTVEIFEKHRRLRLPAGRATREPSVHGGRSFARVLRW